MNQTEMKSHSLVIAGALAQKPKISGHTWVLLQYLLGFRRLGWRTLFIDYLEPSLCVDETGWNCALEGSGNLRYVRDVVRAFGLEEDYVLTGPGGASLIGMPRSRLLERVGHSAALLNIMGYLRDEEILGRASKRIFLDIDPDFGQFWDELGLYRPFAGYDAYVTIGLNIGRPDCTVPTCGMDWIVTPQPVVLEWWPPSDVRGEPSTTIASWRGAYGPIESRGESYGLRVHQFRRFVDLPGLAGRSFELALAIHPMVQFGTQVRLMGSRRMNSGSSSNSRDACVKSSKSRWILIRPMNGTWLRSAVTDGTSSIPRSWHPDQLHSVDMFRPRERNCRSPRGSTSRRRAAGSATARSATWHRANRPLCGTPASAALTLWAKAWWHSARWRKPSPALFRSHATTRTVAALPVRSPRVISIRTECWAS
jgi:hypothetical protein